MTRSLVIHAIDIYIIDDTTTTKRMGRSQTATLVTGALPCRVNERPPGPAMSGGAEIVNHSHRIHINGYIKLTTNHQVWWTNPEGGSVIKMRVLGTKKRPAKSMPYVVYCQAFETGS